MKKVLVGILCLLVLLVAAALLGPLAVKDKIYPAHAAQLQWFADQNDGMELVTNDKTLQLNISSVEFLMELPYSELWAEKALADLPTSVTLQVEVVEQGWWTSDYRYAVIVDSEVMADFTQRYHHGPLPFSALSDDGAPFKIAAATTGRKYDLLLPTGNNLEKIFAEYNEKPATAKVLGVVSLNGDMLIEGLLPSYQNKVDAINGGYSDSKSQVVGDLTMDWQAMNMTAQFNADNKSWVWTSAIPQADVLFTTGDLYDLSRRERKQIQGFDQAQIKIANAVSDMKWQANDDGSWSLTSASTSDVMRVESEVFSLTYDKAYSNSVIERSADGEYTVDMTGEVGEYSYVFMDIFSSSQKHLMNVTYKDLAMDIHGSMNKVGWVQGYADYNIGELNMMTPDIPVPVVLSGLKNRIYIKNSDSGSSINVAGLTEPTMRASFGYLLSADKISVPVYPLEKFNFDFSIDGIHPQAFSEIGKMYVNIIELAIKKEQDYELDDDAVEAVMKSTTRRLMPLLITPELSLNLNETGVGIETKGGITIDSVWKLLDSQRLLAITEQQMSAEDMDYETKMRLKDETGNLIVGDINVKVASKAWQMIEGYLAAFNPSITTTIENNINTGVIKKNDDMLTLGIQFRQGDFWVDDRRLEDILDF